MVVDEKPKLPLAIVLFVPQSENSHLDSIGHHVNQRIDFFCSGIYNPETYMTCLLVNPYPFNFYSLIFRLFDYFMDLILLFLDENFI